MSRIVVLGSGIVGRAAAWDLLRRGHEVIVADADPAVADGVATELGAPDWRVTDASDRDGVRRLLEGADAVVSGVPYRFGMPVAEAAIATGCHYLDFGGNPTVVARQLELDEASRTAGVTLVPDCGLAPGVANVMTLACVAQLGPGPIDTVGLRVGSLPAEPVGALNYQLSFNPVGLINEYAEPCEVLRDGRYTTVEPLTEIEEVTWPGVGTLEAFHTAGGSSSLTRLLEGRVRHLDYKTLRYPGHAVVFRSMLEIGLFDEAEQPIAGTAVAPRGVLLDLLERHLPRGGPDLVLVRIWATAERDGEERTAGLQILDRNDGTFSALARTTAFPATALAHLLVTGAIDEPGARTMDAAVTADDLLPELVSVGVVARPWPEG